MVYPDPAVSNRRKRGTRERVVVRVKTILLFLPLQLYNNIVTICYPVTRKGKPLPTEARARIKINNLLTDAGWRLIDSTTGKANVKLEAAMRMDEMGTDFERTPTGIADYVLLDGSLFPVCVLEAKSEDKDPLVGKEQARNYAKTQKARYILLSNGNLHYFWDTEKGNPTRVSRFPSLETLGVLDAFQPDPARIPAEKVESDYVVLTSAPDYARDPDWLNPDRREEFIKKFGLKFLRPYQVNAIHAVQAAVAENPEAYKAFRASGDKL